MSELPEGVQLAPDPGAQVQLTVAHVPGKMSVTLAPSTGIVPPLVTTMV